MVGRLCGCALLLAALATAQGRGGEMGGMGGSEGGRGEVGGMAAVRQQRQSKFDLFADKLHLSNSQKTEVLDVLNDARKDAQPVEQQLLHARQQMAGSWINGKSDSAEQAAKEYAAAASQLASLEAKAFTKIVGMLKPKQQTKAGPAFELLAQIFEQPAAGGRGRRERN